MHQLSFWANTDHAVNVASVPQRSPFRYPGGKTWLVPYIRQWLLSRPEPPALLIEPFAGGGIVSLTVAAERLAQRVLMVERDEAVSAVWQTIIHDAVAKLLGTPAASMRDQAFQTIVKNRVNRGGIMAPGVGLVKTGENGKGLASRWYPATLQKRILAIVQMRDRLDGVCARRWAGGTCTACSQSACRIFY